MEGGGRWRCGEKGRGRGTGGGLELRRKQERAGGG